LYTIKVPFLVVVVVFCIIYTNLNNHVIKNLERRIRINLKLK
jgi:hypothetical protein